MDKQILLKCMSEEIVSTIGCTDPGAVALASAKAAFLLDDEIESVEIVVSGNVFKNGMNVGISGTSSTGLYLASAIGIVLKDYTNHGLKIMDFVDKNVHEKAAKICSNGIIDIQIDENPPDPLYINATLKSKEHTATVILAHDYDYFIKFMVDDITLFERPIPKDEDSTVEKLLQYPLKEIIQDIIDDQNSDYNFLIDFALQNKESYVKSSYILGENECYPIKNNSFEPPLNMINRAKQYTFTLAKARMNGVKVPVIAVTGSGNHGITNFLGVLAVAECLGVDKDYSKFAKALAISTALVIYIKGRIKRMTAFCGCTVAASTGVCAATVYLLGGDYNQMVNAINSLISSLCGILCDGAKETCAFKLACGVSTAIEYAYHSVNHGLKTPPVCGIISGTLERTFKALGYINDPGMRNTDKALIQLVKENHVK